MFWNLVAPIALLLAAPLVEEKAGTLERYAGSFRLETGEIVTGGLFVERHGDPLRFLYLDTETLVRGGLFEREDELTMRSVIPPGGAVTIELVPGSRGELDRIRWRARGEPPLEGRRVFPHATHAVEIPTAGGDGLRGRLLVPECPGPHPLVAIVGGSGPTTRFGGSYETLFVQFGMAVLSWDKRGVGSPDWSEPDLAELAADAEAALRFGSRWNSVDPNRAGFWGSSQGGWVAPIAAVATAADFLIVRAGPGVSEAETVLHEIRQELREKGLSGLALDHAMALRKEIYDLAMNGRPLAATDPLVERYLEQPWYRAAFGDGRISARWSPSQWGWNQRNLAVAPGPWLRRYAGPVLWFLAEDDENVPLVPSRAALERTFAASAGSDHEIVTIAGASHAFLVTEGGSPRFAPGYWTRMAEWLDARGLSNRGCWSTPSPRSTTGLPGTSSVHGP